MDVGQPKPYSESRTGRGDKWFQGIKDLRAQVDALLLYSEAHQQFRSLIEEGFKVLPKDDSREIARAELMEFCAKREGAAQQAIKAKLRAIQNLENTGVE
jgi:hypothetical protein